MRKLKLWLLDAMGLLPAEEPSEKPLAAPPWIKFSEYPHMSYVIVWGKFVLATSSKQLVLTMPTTEEKAIELMLYPHEAREFAKRLIEGATMIENGTN